MKNRNGYKSGNVSKEIQYEKRRGRDRSERGFGKLSKIKKALPLVLVLAMVFSIATIAALDLPKPDIKPRVQCYVNPPKGNCNTTFTYHVSIIGPREAKIVLEIYQPANNTWEIKDEENQTWTYTTPKAPNGTNFIVKPFVKESKGGISSYRFKYEDGILNTTLGPYSGPSLIVPPPPPQINFTSIELRAYLGPEPSDVQESSEADYHNYSGDTTVFDYEVNATSAAFNDDRWFDISLRVYDPVEEEWKQKGENKPEYFKAGESKNLTWRDIRPFESLNESRIDEYIGKQSKFAFVYAGNKSENLTGPVLVVAFDNPKCNRTVVPYEEWFNYSIDVIGSKELNITLEYLCEGEWINDSINNATWNYTDVGNWTKNHTWDCQAINTWEDVRFRWWEKGSRAAAAKTATLELGVSQLSASKPKRSYPVPVIVKEEKWGRGEESKNRKIFELRKNFIGCNGVNKK